jgi:hypothetical protein
MSDTITVKMERQFTPCPEGSQHAVCVDVIDLGEAVESYQGQAPRLARKVALVFQTDEENAETGKRYEPSIEVTASFGQKAKLRKFLSDWRGKPYTDEEALAGAPLHKLEGVNAILNVQHKTSGAGRVYALIASIAPPMKSMVKIEPSSYTRSDHWAKRKEEYRAKAEAFRQSNGNGHGAAQAFDDMPEPVQPIEDDDLPFDAER